MTVAALVLAGSNLVALIHDRPTVLPSHAVVSQWARVAGHADMGSGQRATYELYVEPSRPMLYAITRYRLSGPDRTFANEMLIWNAQPGTRAPMLCFEHVTLPAIRPGLPARAAWMPVLQGTPPYREAMTNAIRIYVAYQAVLEEQAKAVERRGE